MKLRTILTEITVDQALKLFNIDISDVSDATKLKAAFRTASLKAHPDKGGSDAQFNDVQDAYELLQKQGKNVSAQIDYKAREDKYETTGNNILDKISKEFDTNAYKEHLKNIYNTDFTYKLLSSKLGWGKYTAVVVMEFADDTRDIIFNISMSVDITNVLYNSGGLGDGMTNISYPLGISTSVLFKGKKVKIAVREYSQTRNHDVFQNPELVLPKATLLKFETKSSTKKFSKADMFQILTKKYGMGVEGNVAFKRFEQFKPDRVSLQFTRGTFMKMPYWSFTLFTNGKSDRLPYKTYEENAQTAELFGKITTFAKTANSVDEITEYIKKLI
jgi:DnaJ domain